MYSTSDTTHKHSQIATTIFTKCWEFLDLAGLLSLARLFACSLTPTLKLCAVTRGPPVPAGRLANLELKATRN